MPRVNRKAALSLLTSRMAQAALSVCTTSVLSVFDKKHYGHHQCSFRIRGRMGSRSTTCSQCTLTVAHCVMVYFPSKVPFEPEVVGAPVLQQLPQNAAAVRLLDLSTVERKRSETVALGSFWAAFCWTPRRPTNFQTRCPLHLVHLPTNED